MNLKKTCIILGISVVMATVAAMICVHFLKKGEGELFTAILLPLWAFSTIPSYTYIYYWLRSKDFAEGSRIGAMWGTTFGFMAFAIPILIAPAVMVFFYIEVFNLRKRK